ncbi:MAG: LysM peptidoglycan-binding domain-containing protein [Pseudomonadota bacterium]
MFVMKPALPAAHDTPRARLRGSAAAMLILAGAALVSAGCSSVKDDEGPATQPAMDSSPAPAPRVVTQPAPMPRATPEQRQRSMLLRDGHPERHVVVRGDTLWDISEMFLRDPWLWPEIWYVNPQINNPHLIYPGDVISLVWIDGQPRLTVERDGMTAGRDRLSPQIRVESLDNAITTIPYDAIAPFLTKPVVMDKKQIREAPYIVGIKQSHLVAGAGFNVYVRNSDAGVGTRYNVYHVGEKYIDPDNGDNLGYETYYVGQGRVTRAGDVSTVFLTETKREALPGDRLILEQTELPVNFFPSAPDTKVEGRIMDVHDGISNAGRYQVVVLNRGLSHGVQPGHVLSVWQTGEKIIDRYAQNGLLGGVFNRKVQLPEEIAGRLLVFRSLENVSYGLIMNANSEIAALDIVRNPQ